MSDNRTKLVETLAILDTLPRPTIVLNKKNDADPTPEQLAWATLIYVMSLASQVRAVLRAFLDAASTNTPASLILCRALFELGASAFHARERVAKCLRSNDRKGVWIVLREVTMGNRYMVEHGVRGPGDAPFRRPTEIFKAVRALNRPSRSNEPEKTYAFLCEFTHPNMGALAQHYELELLPREIRVRFPDSPSTDAPYVEAIFAVFSAITSVRSLVSSCQGSPLLRELSERFNAAHELLTAEIDKPTPE
jgi:hypothetical protein